MHNPTAIAYPPSTNLTGTLLLKAELALLPICLHFQHLLVVVLVEYLLLGLAEEVLEVLDEGGVLLVVRLLEVHLQQDNLILL